MNSQVISKAEVKGVRIEQIDIKKILGLLIKRRNERLFYRDAILIYSQKREKDHMDMRIEIAISN